MVDLRTNSGGSRLGIASALALGLSGVAIALRPRQAAAVMDLSPGSARGVAETRAGVGGTFAALGLWAAARGSSDAYAAVGLTWLGAAALRGLSLRADEPETDVTFWAFMAMEIGFGTAGVIASVQER